MLPVGGAVKDRLRRRVGRRPVKAFRYTDQGYRVYFLKLIVVCSTALQYISSCHYMFGTSCEPAFFCVHLDISERRMEYVVCAIYGLKQHEHVILRSREDGVAAFGKKRSFAFLPPRTLHSDLAVLSRTAMGTGLFS